MSDVEPLAESVSQADATQASAVRRTGMFRDPAVRVMTYLAIGLVILFLAMIVGALATGVVEPKGAGPRTAAERQLLTAAETAARGGATGAEWAPYINALVATGDLQKARVTLDTARASVNATATAPELELAEARLELAQKRYAQAAKAAETAMKGFEARQAARLAAGGNTASRAEELGIEADYYSAALVKAYAHVEAREWEDALTMFDVYIARYPTAADILVDRGNAKVELKDTAGAEKDFREALRFVPYDADAK